MRVADQMAERREWQLLEPTQHRHGYSVIDPNGEERRLRVVSTWAQYDRDMALTLHWVDDPVAKQRLLANYRINPWAYGYHVLELNRTRWSVRDEPADEPAEDWTDPFADQEAAG